MIISISFPAMMLMMMKISFIIVPYDMQYLVVITHQTMMRYNFSCHNNTMNKKK